MLCERRLLDSECYAHVFSLQHVSTFLDYFHPGSLDSTSDAETVLDLAKQAAYIHAISNIQVVTLDTPIWEPCSYNTALTILIAASQREGKARLKPPIFPRKKLCSRVTVKDVDKDHVRDNSQNSRMVEECEETTSQKSTDNNETTLNTISVEVGAEVTSSRCVESGETAEKGDDEETPAQIEQESKMKGGVFSETGSEDIKNAGSETCQAIKEDKLEEPTAGSGETAERCQNTGKNEPAETGKERSERSKDVPTQLTEKRKAPLCPVEDAEQEMSHKRQRLTSKEEPQNLTSSKKAEEKEEITADKEESGKPSHETALVKGLSALREGRSDEHDPFYLCECCAVRVPERELINHITGVEHQTKHKMVVNMKIDGDSEDPESRLQKSVMTETTSITTKASLESNEDVKMTSINTWPSEDKAQIISHTTVRPLKIETTSKIEGTSEMATDSTVTTPTTMAAISKFTAKSTNSALDTTKSTAPTSKRTATSSSCTTATKKLRADECTSAVSICTLTLSSVTSLSKPLESRTGAADQVTATSNKAAAASNTESKRAEDICRVAPASKVENACKNSSKTVVASRTVVTSRENAKTTVKPENTEASVETSRMKNSAGSTADVAPNILKSKTPAALHLITPRNSPTEPSHNRPRNKSAEVGSEQLIIVKCEEKQQVYCLLCSFRLNGRCHLTDFKHWLNYAKMKSPEQVSKMTQSELQSELPKLVTVLAETDRAGRSRSSAVTVPVNIDEYRQLAALSADKAIERLKAIMKQTDTSASPWDSSSPDDAVKMVKPQRCAPSHATAAAAGVAHTADTCQETPERRQQQERTCPPLQHTQKVLEGSQKALPVKLLHSEPLSFAATVNTEQQNQAGHRQRAQHVSKHSQALPMISVGASTNARSNLSIFLKGVEPAHIIGLGLVWECRGISMQTFYLCESCSETLPVSDIRRHMASSDHQYNFILRQHPDFLYWWNEPLLPWMKRNILKGIAKRLSAREQFNKMDAQVILLGPEMCEPVKTAPFSDALEIVKNIKEKKKLTIPHPLVSTPQQKDQLPESQQSPEESLPTEVQPSQARETDQRSDNGSRQKTEKHHLKETVGDLDGVKQRRVSGPLDVARVSPEADPVVSPFSHKSPQEQPHPRPPVSQHQSHIPELQVKLRSESPSFSIISPKTSQSLSVSPRDDDHPTRKRPAAESIDSLVRSFTDNPQLEDPLPAKRSELQPIKPKSASESTSVNPATAWTLLSPMDKNTEPGCYEGNTPAEDKEKFDELIALLRSLKSERNKSLCTSAPDNGETTTSCANNSSEGGVERRCDPEPEQMISNVATTRWDSNWGRLEVTNNLTLSTAAPEVLSHDIQLVAYNASSVSHSSLEGSTLTRGNLLFRVTDANTADPGGPQNQIDAQSTFGSQSQPSHISSNPSQTLQPPDNTETDSTGIHPLPINAIVTVRSDRLSQRFTGNCNGQDNSKVNRGNQVTHSFSRVATVSPGDASGGSHHSSQMAYFSSEVFGGYTPANPPVYTESSFQYKEYTTGGPHPNQIYPEQDAARFSLQSFGSRLVTPEWVQMGLLQQQQCSSWTSTSVAAGDGTVISEAAYGDAAPVTTPASQPLINLNDYKVTPTQNSSNMATQNIPQGFVFPPVVHYPRPANNDIISQPSTNSFFSSGRGF